MNDQHMAGTGQTPEFDRPGLMKTILAQFRIHTRGIHGASHWARVRYNAIRIARKRQADLLLVELFAFLHDSQREDEYRDPLHGERAAAWTESLNGVFFDLDRRRLDALLHALRHHSGGGMARNPSIQTCWDADRLDLERIGFRLNRRLLSGDAHELAQCGRLISPFGKGHPVRWEG